jgi:hypothetical protein
MRKLYLSVLAGLLAVSALVVGGGPASAADGSHTSPTLTCTVGNGYTFKYVIHWTSSGKTLRIDDVKVTDAASGHYMRYVGARVYLGSAEFDSNAGTYAWKQTQYPRLKLGAGWWLPGTKANPVHVDTWFVGYTNAGTVTPICHPGSMAAFWV